MADKPITANFIVTREDYADSRAAAGKLATPPSELMLIRVSGAALLLSANMAFAMRLAASAANEPVEFFKLLPMKAANQVKTAVMNAMNGEEQADGKKLVLEKPAAYKDKQYKEIEFTGAAELCAMDMMKAENEIAAKGFATPLPQTNILYCCLIAARASGMDKEFFTGLPLCETVKIRNVVNSEDFFG